MKMKTKKKKTQSILDIAKNDRSFLSKYAALFSTIFGFLILTTAFALLGHQITNENKRNTDLLNAIGLEKTLSQKISKEILIIQREWTSSHKFNTKSFEALASANNAFDSIHQALQKGGNVSFNGSNYPISPLDASYSSDLEKINNAWSPLKIQIDLLAKAYKETESQSAKMGSREKFLNSRKTFSTDITESNHETPFPNDFIAVGQKFVATALDIGASEALNAEVTKTANTFNLYANDLLANVDQLNDTLNQSIKNKETRNTRLQVLMTLLSLILFFFLTFYFLRKNILSDFIIFNEGKEKQAILDNINEGLFLMNSKWVITSEGSLFLHKLFGRQIPVGGQFKDILAQSVDEETLANAERFVNILITKNIKGNMIDSLNPLKLITLKSKDATGQSVLKHVSVHFGQIHDANGQLKHLLVSIQDSTEKHKLSLELKEEIRKNKETFAMLIRLGQQSNVHQVQQLLESIRTLINQNNELLKAGAVSSRTHQLVDFLKTLKNEIHGLKNEAGLFKVDILQKLLHDFEDHLIQLEKQGNITYESFLNIPYQFKNILETIDLIELILGSKPTTINPVILPSSSSGTLHENLDEVIRQTAAKLQKNILLSYDDSCFAQQPVFQKNASTLRTCLIHLAKNSVVHGIELPANRVQSGKEPVGLIKVNGELTDRSLIIRLTDDGSGLSKDRILKKITTLGLSSRPEQLTEDQIYQFIFEQDFSTADTVTVDAGRGIGLNYVKTAIEDLGGSVSVLSIPGHGIEFSLTLPL